MPSFIPEGINEDLVVWIETTGGKMRVFPVNGSWVVDKRDEGTDEVTAIVVGLPTFDIAMTTAIKSIYNPDLMLDASRTLKAQVVRGLDGPMMDEYREKADKVLQARDML